jgi:diguanylate cyclase (GGDEF)-like protein
MSFRTRLISFFVLIVVVPMIAVGVLVYRLIGASEQGKADARANGIASAAASLYARDTAAANADARALAHDPALLNPGRLDASLPGIAARAGLARVTVSTGSRTLADVGDRSAIAPGAAIVKFTTGSPALTLVVSEVTAGDYARDLASRQAAVVVRQGARILGGTLVPPQGATLPHEGNVTVSGKRYRAVSEAFAGFGGTPVTVTVLSGLTATATAIKSTRIVAGAFIVAFLILALAFTLLVSRALQGQLSRFLQAARRLASGDFSSPIRTQGRDEFAALGQEFNNMSNELARRMEELSQQRAQLRQAIGRIGQTFASNLDRTALLDLALKTAIDAAQADCGRVSARRQSEQPLAELQREGSLAGLETRIYAAELAALSSGSLGESSDDDVHVASVPLGPLASGRRAPGVISVARRGRPFSDDERELLRSLAAQAGLALENVELHYQVRRQAVTDELTGLANHGRFQELLQAEIEQVRRYQHPVGLVMLDIDDFKAVNDTYGHQQGDAVLRAVGRVLQQNSRDADSPARYGGEEMALILPHTDLEGAYVIAERVRAAIEALEVPRIDGHGTLSATASLGVAASNEGDKNVLIADADAALYEAKRQGKNRTIRAASRAADAVTAE